MPAATDRQWDKAAASKRAAERQLAPKRAILPKRFVTTRLRPHQFCVGEVDRQI